MTLIAFLALTFGISLAGFFCIALIPAARSPESTTGLPFWLIMVWGPSLAAIVVCFRNGELASFLLRCVKLSAIPLAAWLLTAGPLLVLMLLKPFAPDQATPLSIGMIAAVVLFNLVLGPLGEELGWRGIMQEHLNRRFGWLPASLLIAVVWLVWHLPLWAIDSPHAEISLPLFAFHCLLYSIIIGAAYTLSGGSIVPAILIHLTVNVASNLAVFTGFRDPNSWFSTSIAPYIALAATAIVLVHVQTGRDAFN